MESFIKVIICCLLTLSCISCKTVRDSAVASATAQQTQAYLHSSLLAGLTRKSGKNFSAEDEAKAQLILENNFTFQKTEWTADSHLTVISVTPTKSFQKGTLYCRQYNASLSIESKDINFNAIACRTGEQFWSVD